MTLFEKFINFLKNMFSFEEESSEENLLPETLEESYEEESKEDLFENKKVEELNKYESSETVTATLSVVVKQDGVDIDISYLCNMMPKAQILSEDDKGAMELAKYQGDVLVFMSSKDIYNIANKTKEYL